MPEAVESKVMPLRKVLFAQTEMPAELRAHFAAALRSQPGLELEYIDTKDASELVRAVAQAEVIVGWRLPPEAVAAAERLELWIFPGAGAQSMLGPIRELNKRRKVTLANSHSNAYAVAQHAVALLLALCNRIVPHHNWMAAGRWRTGDAETATLPLRGRRVGLLGYGAINRRVHRLLSGFELEFAALKRNWSEADMQLPGLTAWYEPLGLPALLEWTDTLMIVLPSTPETQGLIGSAELAELGAGGLLVNVARGDIIEEQALYEALRDGVIAGAGLDVWYDYRPQPDAEGRRYPYHFPFQDLPSVVLSPHRAASPIYLAERWEDVIDNLRRYAAGRELINVVDLEAGY